MLVDILGILGLCLDCDYDMPDSKLVFGSALSIDLPCHKDGLASFLLLSQQVRRWCHNQVYTSYDF